VTLHVVMGDGEMTRKELVATMDDLWEREGDGNFWFLLQGKSDPTETDKFLTTWLQGNDLFYAIVTDDKASLHQCYSSAAQTFVAKGLAKKVISLIESEPEDGELVDVLALFTSDDPEAEEDRWLNDLMGEIAEAGHTIRALNDGLTVLDFESSPEEEEVEQSEEEEEVRSKKAPAKKAAPSKTAPSKGAKPKSAAQPEPEEESEEEVEEVELTREDLEAMDLTELKEIAKANGIELPPRTRTTTYIDAILGVDDTPAAEVEEVSSNGQGDDLDLDDLAEAVANILIGRLVKALA
jgi:hypothetical protein